MAALTIILIAAFAIDRLVNGLFFLLSFSSDLRPLVVEAPARADEGASRIRRLIYGVVAGYLGVVVVAGILKVHLFEIIQIAPSTEKPNAMLDTLLTGLILAGGADRLSELVKSFSGGEGKKGAEKPIEITGKLVLEQGQSVPAPAIKSHAV